MKATQWPPKEGTIVTLSLNRDSPSFKSGTGSVAEGGSEAYILFDNKHMLISPITMVDEIIDIFALAQSIPGVIAINTSLLTGFKVAGIFGGIMAGIGVMMPSFIIILIIAPIFERFQNLEYVHKAFLGIRGAIAGLILLSAFGMGKQVIKNKFTSFLFIISFVLVVFLNFNVIYTLLLSALIGWIYYLINKYIIKKQS